MHGPAGFGQHEVIPCARRPLQIAELFCGIAPFGVHRNGYQSLQLKLCAKLGLTSSRCLKCNGLHQVALKGVPHPKFSIPLI